MDYPLPNFQSASKMFLRTKSSASHSLGGRERAGHHDICFSFIWSKCYKSNCYLFFKISIHQMQSFINCPAHDSDSCIIYLYNPKNPKLPQTTHITTNMIIIKAYLKKHLLAYYSPVHGFRKLLLLDHRSSGLWVIARNCQASQTVFPMITFTFITQSLTFSTWQ